MKRWALVTAIVLLVPTTLAVRWLVQPTGPVNAANFDQIRTGMTQSEVEQILGSLGEEGSGDGHNFPMTWQGRGRNEITVRFDIRREGNFVVYKEFFNPGLWDRIKEWWGGYELVPGGGRATKFNGAA
jgi:hypothetical protein